LELVHSRVARGVVRLQTNRMIPFVSQIVTVDIGRIYFTDVKPVKPMHIFLSVIAICLFTITMYKTPYLRKVYLAANIAIIYGTQKAKYTETHTHIQTLRAQLSQYFQS